MAEDSRSSPLGRRRTAVFGDSAGGPANALARAYDSWREEIARRDLYEVGGLGRRFHFSWNAVEMRDAALVSFDAVGLTYVRDAARIRADGIDSVRVQLTGHGGFTGQMGGRDVVVGAGEAVFCDQTLPFSNQSADTRGRTIALPRSAFGGADVRDLHGRIVSGAAFARLNDYVTWLVRAAPGAPASARDRVLAAIGSVVRATFERGGEAEADLQHGGALDGMAVARLRALAIVPQRSVGRSADELARALGVSRSALYRATAPFGGAMEVVWSARLEAARAALSDPARTGRVADFATAFGFADAAHFQRRFRERFGFNPSDLRPLPGLTRRLRRGAIGRGPIVDLGRSDEDTRTPARAEASHSSCMRVSSLP